MAHPSSADRPAGTGPARSGLLPLAAAALLVPTVLAGLALLWPRPQIEDGLTRAADASLAAAGITGARVDVDGRDATVDGPAGAVEVVAGVPGVRVARAGAGGDDGTGDATGTGDGPTVDAGSGTGSGTGSGGGAEELDDAGRQQLAAELESVVAAAPITFEPNSPALTAAGAATVARVVELVVAAPGARLQVDGFVAAGPGDGRLTAQELSDRRAATVAEALVDGGVPDDRVTVRGLGEGGSPVPDAAGRRVEITVV